MPEFDRLGLGSMKMLPWAFEAEVRTPKVSHQDIVQIVSGRQLLGKIMNQTGYCVSSQRIHGLILNTLLGQISQAGLNVREITGELPQDKAATPSLDMSFQGARVAHCVERTNDQGQQEITVYGNDLTAADGSLEREKMDHLGTILCVDQFPLSLRESLMQAIRSVPTPKFSNRIRDVKPDKSFDLGAGVSPKCYSVVNANFEETHWCVFETLVLNSSLLWLYNKAQPLIPLI